jgi:hypothetical protein
MSRLCCASPVLVLWTLAIVGCTDLTEGQPPAAAQAPAAARAPAAQPAATPEAKGRPLLAPTGIASVGDVEAVQHATDGGAAKAPAANQQAAPTQPEKRTGSILGRTTRKIVDLAEAKKNPKIVEFDSKVTGSDPLTVSFNAYVLITSRASVLNFKRQMDILKETNDGKYPSFKEAEKLMQQFKFELTELPPWQLYGYDAKTGGIVVLEDKGEKIRLFNANNIPIEDADKPFNTP